MYYSFSLCASLDVSLHVGVLWRELDTQVCGHTRSAFLAHFRWLSFWHFFFSICHSSSLSPISSNAVYVIGDPTAGAGGKMVIVMDEVSERETSRERRMIQIQKVERGGERNHCGGLSEWEATECMLAVQVDGMSGNSDRGGIHSLCSNVSFTSCLSYFDSVNTLPCIVTFFRHKIDY